MNEVLRTISQRRSHRKYKDTPVTQEQLDAILKAALESPSAVNRQPWHFSVVRDSELLDEMNNELRRVVMMKDETQRSARFADCSFNVFYHAPTVIFISAPDNSDWSRIDCGIAAENIVLAAESLGLGSVILGLPRDIFTGEHADAYMRKLCFPEANSFIIAVAIGVPADDKDAHPVSEGHISVIG